MTAKYLKIKELANQITANGDKEIYHLPGEYVPTDPQPVVKIKCAVKVDSTGQHCPGEGKYKIGDTDQYLCEKCYQNFLNKLK